MKLLRELQSDQVTSVPWGAGFSLLAWGFDDGGKDTTDGYPVVIVDLDVAQSTIDDLRAKGHTVICYFSVGTIEPWRQDTSSNKAEWKSAAAGEMADWDETWMDITSSKTRELQTTRFQRAKEKKCHGVEPDNVDCFQNDDCWTNIPSLKKVADAAAAQIVFNRWQTQLSHSLGLSIALKNTLDLVDDLVDDYDFTINESCLEFKECERLEPFFKQNKMIINVEYANVANTCGQSEKYHLSTKYCKGNGNKCVSSWINCFPAGQTGKIQIPSFPTSWSNLMGLHGLDDRTNGLQVVLMDLAKTTDEIKPLVALGHNVVCSFSGGMTEPFRENYVPGAWAAAKLEGASNSDDGEWLDLRKLDVVKPLVSELIDKAVQKGCQGILLGDLNCEDDLSCVSALGGDSKKLDDFNKKTKDYVKWLGEYSTNKRIVLGLRQPTTSVAVSQADSIDFLLVENCVSSSSCFEYQTTYVNKGKAVLNLEFSQIDCTLSKAAQVSTKYCIGNSTAETCSGSAWSNCFADTVVVPPPGFDGNSEEDSGGHSVGASVGIAFAIIFFAGILAFVLYRRRKRDS